jgi:hypothetical protein
MQSFRRQFYFAVMISLILFGIAKTDYANGFSILSAASDFTEQDGRDQ